MTIFRTQKSSNFTTVRNEFICDPCLTAKAKGLLLYLLSKPDDWVTRIDDIAAHMADGVDSIRSGLKELENARYLIKKRIHGGRGRFEGWETLVYETPLPPMSGSFTETGFSDYGENHTRENHTRETPLSGKPYTGNPTLENPTLLNTDLKQKTELTNTDLKQKTEKERKINQLSVSEKPTNDRPPKGSSKKKGSLTAKEVYKSLENFERFDLFWGWYCQKCAAVKPDRDGKTPAAGSKPEAAIAWKECIESGEIEQIDFRQGCQLFNFSQSGIPHACRFIKNEIWRQGLDAKQFEATGESFVEVPTAIVTEQRDRDLDDYIASEHKRILGAINVRN